jgi:hypothetical protein
MQLKAGWPYFAPCLFGSCTGDCCAAIAVCKEEAFGSFWVMAEGKMNSHNACGVVLPSSCGLRFCLMSLCVGLGHSNMSRGMAINRALRHAFHHTWPGAHAARELLTAAAPLAGPSGRPGIEQSGRLARLVAGQNEMPGMPGSVAQIGTSSRAGRFRVKTGAGRAGTDSMAASEGASGITGGMVALGSPRHRRRLPAGTVVMPPAHQRSTRFLPTLTGAARERSLADSRSRISSQVGGGRPALPGKTGGDSSHRSSMLRRGTNRRTAQLRSGAGSGARKPTRPTPAAGQLPRPRHTRRPPRMGKGGGRMRVLAQPLLESSLGERMTGGGAGGIAGSE